MGNEADQLNHPALNKKADIGLIRSLHQKGLLSDQAFLSAGAVLRPVSDWFSWARQMLLFLGCALVLAGVVFFFAYNWASIGKFFKFGMIEAGIFICVIAAYKRGRTQLSGKVLLLSGAVLVGVQLAVYGQIYQTGADAFELFVGWSFLILGWVIVSEFAALWLLWLVLLNTGMILYWKQVGDPAYHMPYEFLCLTLFVLNGTGLVLREAGVKRGLEWLNNGWLRSLLFTPLLVVLSIPAIHLILEFDDLEPVRVFAALVWAAAAVGGYLCCRFKFRDMGPLALIVMNTCVVLLTVIGKLLFHGVRFSPVYELLSFSIIILVVVSAAAFWLRRTAAVMADESWEMEP